MSVTALPTPEDPLLTALIAMRRAMPVYLQLQALLVQVRRHAYLEYRKAGFDDTQALTLAQTHGLTL